MEMSGHNASTTGKGTHMRTTVQRRRLLRWAAVGGLLATAVAIVAAGSGIAAAKAKPGNTSPPKIVGAARVGQVLTGDRGTWTNNPTKYDFAWLRCDSAGGSCASIGGANSTTYTLTSSDDGRTIRFRVAATNSDGTTVAASAATAVVTAAAKPTNTSPPTISGTAQEGSSLVGNNGTWTNSPTRYDLSWLRCDKKGGSCASISGANKGTYTLTSADVGNTVRIRVSATNSAGSNVAASAATAVVSVFRGNGCPPGGNPDQVTSINSPARLLVDTLQSDPQIVASGTQVLVVRFHVTSTCGGPVQGALVYATATPYNQFSIPPEQPTGAGGWATVTFQRLSGFPISHKQQLIAMFVRARKPGENLLTGISTRRLVSVRVDLKR
jgi:hypothetical protein